ncbi:hypothetical protein TNCV_945411 [Trichonephila clavipes]|nr:hypothetical protein TNCV_945411 [Trichonephila clavipes]
MENLVMKDRRLTVRETVEQAEISTGSPRAILCDHAQSGGKICYQASVCGIEKLHLLKLHKIYWILLTLNLVSCDFWLFPNNENATEKIHFQRRDEIRQKATAKLNTIPKERFQKCFLLLKEC